MPVSIKTDDMRRRAVAVVPPGTRWRVFEKSAIASLTAAPDLADWNWIIDDQGPMDDVDVEGMVRIGETFRQLSSQPQLRTHTVVVTTDRFFEPWARVIDANYGNRKHHAAPTLASASALLDELAAAAHLESGGR